jgi:hypothetical protein
LQEAIRLTDFFDFAFRALFMKVRFTSLFCTATAAAYCLGTVLKHDEAVASAIGQTTVVALEGDSVLGGNGIVSSIFSAPSINDRGQVAFLAVTSPTIRL